MNINRALLQILSGDAGSRTEVVDFFVLVRGSGVTTAPATPAMQGGGTLGGRHVTKLTVC